MCVKWHGVWGVIWCRCIKWHDVRCMLYWWGRLVSARCGCMWVYEDLWKVGEGLRQELYL